MTPARLIAEIQRETGILLTEADPILAAAIMNRLLLADMVADIETAGERATADVLAASRDVAEVCGVFPEHLRLLGDALVGRMAQEMRGQVARAETARRGAVRAAWASGAAFGAVLVVAGGVLLRTL